MSGTEIEKPAPSTRDANEEPAQTPDAGFNVSDIIQWELNAGNPGSEPSTPPQQLSAQMERFSALSSGITRLLSELSELVEDSMNQLQGIQSAVDLKKKELKTLHDIDVSATALEKLMEDHRLQRENMESLMQSQRRAWEEEKAGRIQEENEYQGNLKRRRQLEEEDYKRMWTAEQQKARQELEDELRAARQKGLEQQEALEKDCREREQVLKEKELELTALVQELERFMSKLSMRTRSQASEQQEMKEETSLKFPLKELPNPDF